MNRSVWRGLIRGGIAGVGCLCLLVVVAVVRSRGAGGGDAVEWYSFYATLAGMPLSSISGLLIRLTELAPDWVAWIVLSATVPLNWALLGGVIGFVFRRRNQGSEP